MLALGPRHFLRERKHSVEANMIEEDSREVRRQTLSPRTVAPVSVAQRHEIVSLLSGGLSRDGVAAKIGVTPGQVSAIKAHMSMGTYCEDADAVAAVEAENEVADAFDAAFGLERDLQLALRRSIVQLEPGLTVIDGDREQTVASGRIDITARDRNGAVVVIELKAGIADRDAIGQILSYMGDLMDGTTSPRGIIVAREFSTRAIAAARLVPHMLRLVRYGHQFSFDIVATTSPAT
jgi:hypothetical protein